MPRTPQDVTDAELALLRILWSQPRATVREMTEAVYPAGASSDYATVQKLLERLENKKFVTRDRSVWPHVYKALLGRDDLIGKRLQATADKLCEGSLTLLLTHLVRAQRLTRQELDSLHQLLQELQRDEASN